MRREFARLSRLARSPVLSLRTGLARQLPQQQRWRVRGTAEPGPSQKVPAQPPHAHLSLGGPPGAGEPSQAQHPCSQDWRSAGIVSVRQLQPGDCHSHTSAQTGRGPAFTPCTASRVLRALRNLPVAAGGASLGPLPAAPAAPLCEAPRAVPSSVVLVVKPYDSHALSSWNSSQADGGGRPKAGGSVSLPARAGPGRGR